MLFLFLGFIKLNFEEWTGTYRTGGKKWTGLQDCRIYRIDFLGLSWAMFGGYWFEL